jgi:hypothetical protein
MIELGCGSAWAYDQMDGADNGQTTVASCEKCHNAITLFNSRN